MSTVTGVDAQGFVQTVGDAALQPEFQPVLTDVCATLSQAGLGLEAIFVYGSVARGNARPGESDLDLTLVAGERPDAHARVMLHEQRNMFFQAMRPA